MFLRFLRTIFVACILLITAANAAQPTPQLCEKFLNIIDPTGTMALPFDKRVKASCDMIRRAFLAQVSSIPELEKKLEEDKEVQQALEGLALLTASLPCNEIMLFLCEEILQLLAKFEKELELITWEEKSKILKALEVIGASYKRFIEKFDEIKVKFNFQKLPSQLQQLFNEYLFTQYTHAYEELQDLMRTINHYGVQEDDTVLPI
jgi:hypothetical protein